MSRLSVRSLVGLLVVVVGCGDSDKSTGVPPGTYTLERLDAAHTFTGTGNGLLTNLAVPTGTRSEQWLVTVTTAAANGGTFSVVGSLSGARANAVVGTPYSNGNVSFTIADGTTDFVVGDRFTITTGAHPATGMTVGQDSSAYAVIGVNRAGTDTTIKGVRLTFDSDDYTIATVDGVGLVTGLKGGTTNITARLGNATATIPVTVNAHPATFVELTILTGPAGGALKSVSADTGTYYALPADPISSRLKGIVRVGNDTVFCNFCNVKTPARVQRVVRFRSLDTTLATINNANNPTLQTSTDTTGRITAFDTTSTGVKFVMEVPADNLADTVTVKFSLRPIDSLGLRPDSNFFPTANGTGLQKAVYPNADLTQANVKASSSTNFIVGIDFLSRVQNPPTPAGAAGTVRFIPSRLFGTPTVFRKSVPNVTWTSANTDYLTINAAGSVTGVCASINAPCLTTGSSVLTCTSTGGQMPAAFLGIGTYSVPSCSPARTFPMPGALCTTTSSTDLNSVCSIWVRATAFDQVVPTKLMTSRYRINIGR
jgi:hypothetical protein